MKLSDLQKYILKQSWQSKDKTVSKAVLEKFYFDHKVKPKEIINIITKSVERLIKKGLVIGYGWRTPEKWYIRQVKLTSQGKKFAKNLFGIQQELPFKNLKSKKRKSK